MSQLPKPLDLEIRRGSTFTRVVRYEDEVYSYVAISAIARTAPARITAAAHGIPDGWRVAVVSVQGMRQINAENDPPRERDFHRATVVDANTVDLNDVNAAEFTAYRSGGYLQFYTPISLAGCTARMTVKDQYGGTALLELTSTGGEIVLNNPDKTITITIDAATTAAIDWDSGVYDLEIEDGSGVVTPLFTGSVTVNDEVTT